MGTEIRNVWVFRAMSRALKAQNSQTHCSLVSALSTLSVLKLGEISQFEWHVSAQDGKRGPQRFGRFGMLPQNGCLGTSPLAQRSILQFHRTSNQWFEIFPESEAIGLPQNRVGEGRRPSKARLVLNLLSSFRCGVKRKQEDGLLISSLRGLIVLRVVLRNLRTYDILHNGASKN